MEADKIILNKSTNEENSLKSKKRDIKNLKSFSFFFKASILFIFTIILFFFLTFMRKKFESYNNILTYKNKLINNSSNSYNIYCSYTKQNLNNRSQPFFYEDELYFITDLILCDIPFSLIRFADGENSIMKGIELTGIDMWHWSSNNKKFQESLIESASICSNGNNFIGIPCKNWKKISKSILSFSNCSSSKYMTYSTLFTNKNFENFKYWLHQYIISSNRRKIILVANSKINKNIEWAYKFFPVPDTLVDNWEHYSPSLLFELSEIAKKKNLIFFISAGPSSNIIISNLIKINSENIYIDFGSSIEFITKGYSTRSYFPKEKFSKKSCETFILKNKMIIYK